jgi:hypothetical protein
MKRLDAPFPTYMAENIGEAWGFDLDKVAAEFPPPSDERWMVFKGSHEPEKRAGGQALWGPETTRLFFDLVSPALCRAVGEMLGYKALVADTYGGGYHLSGPGARLDCHRDFSSHPVTGARRRANILLFLNRGWDPAWGGCLELGQGDGKVTIEPEFGRLVIFECSERSWHGHPIPITAGHWRKSVACYMYDQLDVVPPAEVHDTQWWDER